MFEHRQVVEHEAVAQVAGLTVEDAGGEESRRYRRCVDETAAQTSGDFDRPLSDEQMALLLARVDAALAVADGPLPDQEVLRLWWGSTVAAPGVRDAVGVLYGHWTDWEEGLFSESETRKALAQDAENVRRALNGAAR